MMKFISLFVFLWSCLSFSQQLVNQSIDSGGETVSVSNLQIIYTVGEVNIQEFQGGFQVSEGFINPLVLETLSVVNSILSSNAIVLFPNPATTNIFIKGLEKKTKYIVYDTSGKKILEGVLFLANSQVDISHLQSGYYLVKLDNQITIPFIKK